MDCNSIILDTILWNPHAQYVYEALGFWHVCIQEDAWTDQMGVPQSFVDFPWTCRVYSLFIAVYKKNPHSTWIGSVMGVLLCGVSLFVVFLHPLVFFRGNGQDCAVLEPIGKGEGGIRTEEFTGCDVLGNEGDIALLILAGAIEVQK